MNSIKKPASDLINTSGQAVDVGQAAALAQQGKDLSVLNPLENKMWQNRIYPAIEEAPGTYPTGTKGVQFLSEEAALPFTYMSRVQSLENPNLFYRLSLSRLTHTVLMRAALLRKLGYYLPSPKYYKNLRLYFRNEEEKKTFLSNAQESMISDFESRGWVVEDNKENHSVVFSDAVLEPAMAEYFDIHWGYAPDPNNPKQLPAVQRYSRYRAYRALILPFSLVEVPESINRFSAKFGSILSGHVVINHPSAESFSAASYEDVRWLVRRLSEFRYNDFADIVRAGAFPPELEGLILAKLLHRAHNALELFSLKNTAGWPLPDLNLTSHSGLVTNGKVTREFVPGFPQRFAHGDRQSPFQDGDLNRYMGIRGKSAAISTVLNHINEKLDLLSVGDLYQGRREEMTQRILQHIRERPYEPLYQKVEAWGGPVGGFNLAATRHVTTGTYFGSSAPIQLVDNVSVAGRLGYFMTLEGLPKISPFGGANIMVMRDYTHVRPLNSLQEGTKVSWKDLLIPRFMKKLASVLDQNELIKSTEEGKPDRQPLDAFLAELREGEVFTITDSIALSAYAQASSSLDVLLGISPLNYLNSVAVGVDGNRAILRQTSFMRTKEGIQVYVRSQTAKALGMSLDLNYFINVMRVRASTTWADLSTDAFVIDYNPEYAEYIDSENKDAKFVKEFIRTRDNLKPALRALFKENDPEILYARFQHRKFEIDHDLKTREVRTKLFALRVNKFNEDHLLKILYPRSEEAPDLNPQDEEITLFANKRGELKGRDLLGFAFDWFEGIMNKWSPKARVDLARSDDPNPANTPFGKAYWRTVVTESDLTKNAEQYPSVAIVQHVWGGWHLNRKKFLKLIDEVQGELKDSPVASYRLIEKEAFANVTAIDFYRITANLSILPGGLDKIRDLILQPDQDGKSVPKAKFIGRLFQKLSEKMGRHARPHDKEMYKDMVTVLGNGNFKAGETKFVNECREEQDMHKKERTQNYTGSWVNGTYFDCMLPWMEKLLKLSASYPKDKKSQTQWMTNVIYVLEEEIPLPQLLKFLGEDNYIYFVRMNGFRTGDEDGDIEYFSNTLGDPKKKFDYANGLIQMFANKTRISPIELDKSLGSFR
ncbi:hypothetical protein [Bdellovibrio reynosensis]|uniref:Uncharacterized protein n=1 Tax=Bdellovibrio reynosensis TaxID=2835041 RepID=A0ABY4CCE6_9BACT|nr:hypothetical protein [Bdellovibrio reynosensis]UOF02647.1 hypothetical protein MNR06_06750 [Bdellovibrio reynosensis]